MSKGDKNKAQNYFLPFAVISTNPLITTDGGGDVTTNDLKDAVVKLIEKIKQLDAKLIDTQNRLSVLEKKESEK